MNDIPPHLQAWLELLERDRAAAYRQAIEVLRSFSKEEGKGEDAVQSSPSK